MGRVMIMDTLMTNLCLLTWILYRLTLFPYKSEIEVWIASYMIMRSRSVTVVSLMKSERHLHRAKDTFDQWIQTISSRWIRSRRPYLRGADLGVANVTPSRSRRCISSPDPIWRVWSWRRGYTTWVHTNTSTKNSDIVSCFTTSRLFQMFRNAAVCMSFSSKIVSDNVTLSLEIKTRHRVEREHSSHWMLSPHVERAFTLTSLVFSFSLISWKKFRVANERLKRIF